jgi:hypothetical protein
MDPNNVTLLVTAGVLLAAALAAGATGMVDIAFISGFVGLVLVYYVWYDESRHWRNRDK